MLLVKIVKSIANEPASHPLSGANRQLLAELEVPVDSNATGTIHSWLIQILTTLNLGTDFLNRISKSAQEAVLHTTEPDGVALASGHIHLLVYAPHASERDGKTWGFFRIDKVDSRSENQTLPGHSIEFYLYVEGE
jgi:hypothetical protein